MTRAEKLSNQLAAAADSVDNAYMAKLLTDGALELARLNDLINNAHTADFLKAVGLEAAHQIERWGEAQKREKSAEAWYWLTGYLAGKGLRANVSGDREKALHHTISSAAALLNWHDCIMQNPDATGAALDADLARHDVEIAEGVACLSTKRDLAAFDGTLYCSLQGKHQGSHRSNDGREWT